MKIGAIVSALEEWAPPGLQESYDNAGLLTGSSSWECKGVLTTLDVTEEVLDEAIERNCNLVVAHHPIIFGGLKRLTGRNYVERIVIKAIKNDLAIYATHTNLDNVHTGVNRMIGEKLGVSDMRILQPKSGQLRKLYTYVPQTDFDKVRDALFEAGAGRIGEYDECCFSYEGTGTFRGSEQSNPAVGEAGKRESVTELKLEVLYPAVLEGPILAALKKAHPYEEVAYELISLENSHQQIGAGMIGQLAQAVPATDFLDRLKLDFGCGAIRHTELPVKPISKVAWCGGSGQFLLSAAMRAGADVFITGDFKYHEFFDADRRILIADIGHYESEQFTKVLIMSYLQQKFPNFAVLNSGIDTNPVKYR